MPPLTRLETYLPSRSPTRRDGVVLVSLIAILASNILSNRGIYLPVIALSGGISTVILAVAFKTTREKHTSSDSYGIQDYLKVATLIGIVAISLLVYYMNLFTEELLYSALNGLFSSLILYHLLWVIERR